MKFAEHLWTHLTPEWYSQYIEYEAMKEMLAKCVTKAQQLPDANDILAREQIFLYADEQFFRYCTKEVSKINTFFAEKLAEALRRFEPLKKELQNIEEHCRHPHSTSSKIYPTNDIEANGAVSNSDDKTNVINLDHVKSSKSIIKNLNQRTNRTFHRKLNDLKLAFSEFYLMLVLLKNYQTLNFTGFRKILKKHDKLFETTRGDKWRQLHIDSAAFHMSKRVDQLIEEVEKMYIDKLEYGDRTRAMERLRVPPLEEKQAHIVTFRLGLFVGMLCLLFPILIILGFTLRKSQSGKDLLWRPALDLYRPIFLILIHICFIGMNVYGWTHSGVNHILIFEFDPRDHLTYQKLLEIGTFLMSLWFLSFIGFIISSYYEVQPFIQPLIFVICLIIFLINPTRIFYHKARFWLLKKLGQVFLAPFYHVDFASFWLGDQLVSLELIFFDLEYFICFYIYDSNWGQSDLEPGALCRGWSQVFIQTILIILPSWFRFAQCLRRYRDTKHAFPHLANAGKYATGFFVSIANSMRRATVLDYRHNKRSNPYLYVWAITAFIGSTYKLIWDLKMDWGFFQKNSGRNKYLREQIIYRSKIYYYIVIIEDIIFRYIWIINIFLYFETSAAEYADIIGFAFGIIEIFRRFIWNYFRLENEHLNNCGQFRAVRDISVQITSLPTTDYAERLNKINKKSELDNLRHPKRRHSAPVTINEEKIMKKNRTMTIINETNDQGEDLSNSQTALQSTAEQIGHELNAILTVESSINH